MKEVFKLIDNNANFPNTIFITGYDREYVEEVLGSPKNYIDKYFHRKKNLPLNIASKVELFHRFTDADIDLRHIFTENILSLANPYIRDYLTSVRQLKKFVSMLSEIETERWQEVNAIDMFRIMLIRLLYPAEYEIMRKRECFNEEYDNYQVRRLVYKPEMNINSEVAKLLQKTFRHYSREDAKPGYRCVNYTTGFYNYFPNTDIPIFHWTELEDAIDKEPFDKSLLEGKYAHNEEKVRLVLARKVAKYHIKDEKEYKKLHDPISCCAEVFGKSKSLKEIYKEMRDDLWMKYM